MGRPIDIRLLDIYRIGLGPSSSHTVGPDAGRRAGSGRRACGAAWSPERIEVDLKGSLSVTGRGHGTDRAVLAGLHGWHVEDCDVDAVQRLPATLEADARVAWGAGTVAHPARRRALRALGGHARRGAAASQHDGVPRRRGGRGRAHEQTWCSVGGGFVHRARPGRAGAVAAAPVRAAPSLPRRGESRRAGPCAGRLARRGRARQRGRAGRGRRARRPRASTVCGRRSARASGGACEKRGELPGGLGVRRRSADLLARVEEGRVEEGYAHIARAQAYAFAVNEENAAGGRVVTAPTNGAAGIVPGVLVEVADRRGLDRARDPPRAGDRGRDREAGQDPREHLRGRGRLPGRGRQRHGDGRGGALRDPRRHGRPGAASRRRSRSSTTSD